MSIDFELMKLIARGKKPDARYDIIQLIKADKATTIAILDTTVELQDKAIRNFIFQLEEINYVELMRYRMPGDKWITIIIKKEPDIQFDIDAVIAKHKATRKKRQIYVETKLVKIKDEVFTLTRINKDTFILENTTLKIRHSYQHTSLSEAKKSTARFMERIRKRVTPLAIFLKGSEPHEITKTKISPQTHLVRNETGSMK